MSLVHESDAYRAYYNLCIYIGRIPLRKSKWKKKNCTETKQNKTVEDIKRELNELRAYA